MTEYNQFNYNNHFDLHSNDDHVPINVVTVTVHPSVTRIEGSAFSECSQLVSIMIPESVTSIGHYAFYGCSSLMSIIIPGCVTKIGYLTFFFCSNLASITLPNSLVVIGDWAFSYCSSLKSIIIPNSLATIGEYAFRNCFNLKSLIIPDAVTEIKRCAFLGCSSLASVMIPESVKIIGKGAFGQCDALKRRLDNGINYNTDTEIWLRQRFVNLPLHQAFYDTTKLSTTQSPANLIQQHKSMLTSTDAMGMTPLHVLCSNPKATTEMIQIVKSAQSEASSMRDVLNQSPLMTLLSVRNINDYHDTDGQLLEEIDKASGLMPFMVAASLLECGLDVVYKLAMIVRPDLFLPGHHYCSENDNNMSRPNHVGDSDLGKKAQVGTLKERLCSNSIL